MARRPDDLPGLERGLLTGSHRGRHPPPSHIRPAGREEIIQTGTGTEIGRETDPTFGTDWQARLETPMFLIMVMEIGPLETTVGDTTIGTSLGMEETMRGTVGMMIEGESVTVELEAGVDHPGGVTETGTELGRMVASPSSKLPY